MDDISLKLYHNSVRVGLRILEHIIRTQLLQSSDQKSPTSTITTALLCCLAFRDAQDPWSNPQIVASAAGLQDKLFQLYTPLQLSDAVTAILKDHVKPALMASRNPAITEMGRRAIDPIPKSLTVQREIDESGRSWTRNAVYIPTVLVEIMGCLDKLDVRARFPVFQSIF